MPVSVICMHQRFFFKINIVKLAATGFVVNALQGCAKPLGAMHAARKAVWGETIFGG